MKHPNVEIEEKVQPMSANDSSPSPVVPLPFVQFIDRTIEAERRLTEDEFLRRDDALEAHVRLDAARHDNADDKVAKATKDLERRLEEMNQFRAQINQERQEYLPREMYEREHNNLGERVKNLEIDRGQQSGKTAAYASMVGFVVIGIQVLLHFWK
jgi:hypothetical protein